MVRALAGLRCPLLGAAQARDVLESVLERFRQQYRFYIAGYVVMPEHVHLPNCFV